MARRPRGAAIRTVGVPARRRRLDHVPEEKASSGGLAALALVGLAVAVPWAFGGTPEAVFRGLCGLVLAVAALAALRGGLRGDLWRPDVPVWPALGLLALGALQLVPLPAGIHAALAPGSAEVWHPAAPAARAVLGDAPAPLSLDPAATLRWIGWVGGLASLVLISAAGWRRARRPELLVAALLGGVAAVAVFGVAARHWGGELIYGRFAVETVAPFGPFVSKNHFAGYVALAVPLAAGLAAGLAARARAAGWQGDWTRGPEVVPVMAALLAGLVPAFAVFVSLSRGGVLNVCTGAAVFGAAWWWRSRRLEEAGRGAAIAAGAAVAIAVAVLAGALPEEARRRVGSVASRDSSGSFRLRTWSAALDAAATSPALGQGLGAFADALPRFKADDGELRVTHAENDYLELLVDAGGVGLSLALLAVGLVFLHAFRALLGAREGLRAGLGLGALGGLAGIAVHSAVDFNLRIPSNALLAATLAALALGVAPLDRRPLPKLGALAWGGALVAALAGVLAFPGGAWPRARALAERAGGAARASELRLGRAEEALRAALAERPALAEAWLLLAWTRAAAAEQDAAELAAWAVGLDPQREALQRESKRLRGEEEPAPAPAEPAPVSPDAPPSEPAEGTALGEESSPEGVPAAEDVADPGDGSASEVQPAPEGEDGGEVEDEAPERSGEPTPTPPGIGARLSGRPG